ncbi:MAG: tRNA (N(6)-L-threonylcarbamoyladenosine(37)-C(2))-methylthiotransferase MtaB [Clostridia bacterium]|jgi:MiaB-like protein
MKVAFYTLGCKVNQYETNGMIQAFLEKGYEIVDFTEKSDIYIINTCTVTSISDKKSRQMIRRTKQLNPEAIVVAVGCYAQVAKDKLEEIKDIDLILGISEKTEIIKYVEEEIKERNPKTYISDVMHQKQFVDFGSVNYTDKNRVAIKVQDGCNQFCTYCIIPYARGRIRSRKIENVKKEVEDLAQKGIKEIVITGIHVASYGKDLEENIGLIDLLEEINKIDGIERIRLSSLEPTLITEEFVKRLSKLAKICDHFHLSLQSGCNETLKRMNRHYTTEDFKEATELLRKTYPNVALTTDIIVGFPGETEEEFNITYEFLKEINFYKMHVFKYSPRHGTKAEKMPNQIDGNIKEERSKKLIELSDKNEINQNKRYINKNLDVLIEEFEEGYYKGHTTNYIMVKIQENTNNLQNKIVTVKIIDNEGIDLIGKIEKVY